MVYHHGALFWERLCRRLCSLVYHHGDIYVAWSSLEPTKISNIGKFDANGDLLWEASLEHPEHTIFDMVVIDDKIYTAGGASNYKAGVIYSLSTDDGSIHWKSVQRNPIVDFLDIETDGTALYLSGTSKGKDGYGLTVARNTHSFKYDLDGNQVWYSNSKHYGQLSEEYGSTIKEGDYEEFFQAAMKKFGIKSPDELKSDEAKKKFFNYVDKNYKAKAEGRIK